MSKRIKAPALESREQFEAAVDAIARLQNRIDQMKARQTAAEQRIKTAYGVAMKPLLDELKGHATLAEKFAEENRSTLFAKDSKSDTTALAAYGFRTGNPFTATRSKWTWEKVIDALREHKLTAYLIPTFAVAKTKILADGKDGILKNDEGKPVALSEVGILIDQDETFFIEPKAEDARTIKAVA